MRVEVINALGQLVYTRQVQPKNGMLNETIDISSQPNGMYMLRMGGEYVRIVVSH